MTGLRIYKKIVDILADIIYVLILLYLFIALPYLFGYNPMVVLTGSMDKAYSKGSIIYYRETSKENLKKGDVITFSYEGSDELITHRITSIDGTKYHTKGDANESEDPIPVEFENIKGEVGKIYIPYAGYVANYVKNHKYLLVIAALILIAEFILNNLKIFNKKYQEKIEEDPEVKEFIKEEKKEQEKEKKGIKDEESIKVIELPDEDEEEEVPVKVVHLDNDDEDEEVTKE